MTTPIKILLGVLFVACLATLGAFAMLGSGGLEFRRDAEPSTQPDPVAKPEEIPAGAAATAGPGERHEIEPVERVGSESAQGVRGRIEAPSGAPVAGARVYLIPGIGGDIVKALELSRRGVRTPPVAMATTAADGEYALGVADFRDGDVFDIYVLHPDFCDAEIRGVAPQPGDWYEAGATRLKFGVRVFGLVTNEYGGGIAGARIEVQRGQGFLYGGAAPGREQGLAVETDASGHYSLDHLDPIGVLGLKVTASGFSNAEKRELQFAALTNLQLDFELGRGSEIAGTVFDPSGKAVADAKVTVMALSQKKNLVKSVNTGPSGSFAVANLDGGAYAVVVDAAGFQQFSERPFQAGTTDLEIVLEQLGGVLITVIDQAGRPARNFHCNIKTATETGDGYTFGRVVTSEQVGDAGPDGALIGGLRPMNYVAEVFLAGHAKNFSAPFEIVEAATEPPRVTVKLNRGGRMTGRVVDGAGQPVVGARVRTRPFGATRNPFEKMFPRPYRITRREVVSDARGQFTLELLHPGIYQLEVADPRYCTTLREQVEVLLGQHAAVGDLQMLRGCEVSGVASYHGKAAGQIKVSVSSLGDKTGPGFFKLEAVSDNLGRFVLAKRLPPGRYEIMGGNQLNPNIFERMVELKDSCREFTVSRTDRNRRVDVSVGKR